MDLASIFTELIVLFIMGFIALVGVAVSAWVAVTSKRVLNEVNDAVNHRHEKRGDGAPKMYDLLWETHEKTDELIEWKRTYDGGPLSTGLKVVNFVSAVNDRLERLEDIIQNNE
jgi:hypothetical protein